MVIIGDMASFRLFFLVVGKSSVLLNTLYHSACLVTGSDMSWPFQNEVKTSLLSAKDGLAQVFHYSTGKLTNIPSFVYLRNCYKRPIVCQWIHKAKFTWLLPAEHRLPKPRPPDQQSLSSSPHYAFPKDWAWDKWEFFLLFLTSVELRPFISKSLQLPSCHLVIYFPNQLESNETIKKKKQETKWHSVSTCSW